MTTFSRRKFLSFLGVVLLSIPVVAYLVHLYKDGASLKKSISKIHGAAFHRGHKLLRLAFKKISRTENLDVLIIGSGISGLSAGRELLKDGITHFKIIELEDKAGGNSKSGETKSGKHPWGAHYLPIPSLEMKEIIDFLKDTGVIIGEDAKGLPIYHEEYLCHEPEDRLYIHGRWQNGLIPHFGVPEQEQKQIQDFLKLMDEYKHLKDADGKYAFTIPVANSSKHSDFIKLDTQSMKQFMLDKGFKSSYLLWYVDYCCKDDFGTSVEETSAWAGIHYFAGRRGQAANAEANDILTWPEGNGWLMEKLKSPLQSHIMTSNLAYEVNEKDGGYEVLCWDVKSDTVVAYQCKQLIFACPQFVTKYIRTNIAALKNRNTAHFIYSSWLVANLNVNALPEKAGVSLCWDNVIYQSDCLGYINSNNQTLAQMQSQTNLTFYKLLTLDDKSKSVRKKALQTSAAGWEKIVERDLKIVYPDLAKHILRYDFWVWGHAMIKPLVNFMWHNDRLAHAESIDKKIHFAHTDLSGLSIFEEGFYQGLDAAQKVKKSFHGEA